MTTISEKQAAELLGVNRATLATWRKKGLLAEGLLTAAPSFEPPKERPTVHYDLVALTAVTATRQGLFRG